MVQCFLFAKLRKAQEALRIALASFLRQAELVTH